MPGFGALGQFALGEGPFAPRVFFGGQRDEPTARKKFEAISATGFVARIAPTQIKFSEPPQGFLSRRWVEPTSAAIVSRTRPLIFDRSQDAAIIPPRRRGVDGPSFIPRAAAIITRPSQQEVLYRAVRGLIDAGFIQGPRIVFRKPSGDDTPLLRPLTPHFELYTPSLAREFPPAPLDVFVKDWRKKKRRPDLLEQEIAEKAARRAALELAVYGPAQPEIAPGLVLPHSAIQPPPNVEELARVIMAATEAQGKTHRAALDQDDEDVIELILRDL